MPDRDQYRIALYELGDMDSSHSNRIIYGVDELPEVGTTIKVPDNKSIYDGGITSHLSGRVVRIVDLVRHRTNSRYARLGDSESNLHHFYVQIADPFERLAAERLRRLFWDLGGTWQMGLLALIDYGLMPEELGGEKIAELMKTLYAAGIGPQTVNRWYTEEAHQPTPGWLKHYL